MGRVDGWGHATLCLHDGESGDSIRSSVLLPSCLGLMPSTADAAALHGFKMFCLDLGRLVFVPWCGVDRLPLMDLVRRNWIEKWV